MPHGVALFVQNLYNNTRTVLTRCLFFRCHEGTSSLMTVVSLFHFSVCLRPLHREVSAVLIKAGLLTLFHSQAPSRPCGQWLVLESYKGTHSCETVGDFHSVPLLIAFVANLNTFFMLQIYTFSVNLTSKCRKIVEKFAQSDNNLYICSQNYSVKFKN